jgi:hypothetical protein
MSILHKHIVIVHGIGDQALNETGVNFMNSLCRVLPDDEPNTFKVVNLVGRVENLIKPDSTEPAYVVFTTPKDTYYISFSEVYWQPVTNAYVEAHKFRLPVPIFTWAHSINNRIRGPKRGSNDLAAWRETIDNFETLLHLVRKLAAISKKAEILHTVLVNFLGDVEMYTECGAIHNQINEEFGKVLDDVAPTRDRIAAGNPRQKVPAIQFDDSATYIVAHSEGTVVSWRCMMAAAEAQPNPEWLGSIRGFVTMGSPIDKHHLIWTPVFKADTAVRQNRLIRWWNFWDISDPVGYSLSGIFTGKEPRRNNQFERVFDSGYARYPVPGLAHQGYWEDPEILRKIAQEVLEIKAGFEPEQMDVTSRWWGKKWIMRSGDFLAYGVLRVATMYALFYFLAHLLIRAQSFLAPVRDWVVAQRDAVSLSVSSAYYPDFFRDWPFPKPELLHILFWLAAPAFLWKLLWDFGPLHYWQEKRQGRNLPRRIELWAMFIWTVAVLTPLAFSHVPAKPCGVDCYKLMDYVGWATGLVVSILGWKLHTTIHKGLVQLWRYTQGASAFGKEPPPGAAPAVVTPSKEPGGSSSRGDEDAGELVKT